MKRRWPTVLGVLLEHGVAGGAGAGEAVQNQRILVGGDLQDALDQAGRVGGCEIRNGWNVMQNLPQFLARTIGMSGELVCP